MDHVDCFAITFTQSRRRLEFIRKFRQKQTDKKKVKLSCAVCNGESLGRCHCVDTIMSNLLKYFVMNKLSRHGEMITRKSTGIVEADHLCHKCYEAVRKEVLLNHYSPMKKQRTKSLVKTTTSTVKDRLEDKYVWCGRSKKDGKWCSVDGVVAEWIEKVDREKIWIWVESIWI